MSYLDTYAALQRVGIDLLEEVGAHTAATLTGCGLSSKETARLLRLFRIYFGTTRSHRKQRDAVSAARANGHSLDTLDAIHSAARGVHDGAEVTMWDLLVEFCGYSGSYADIKRRAKQRVTEINLRVADRVAQARTRRFLRISATPTPWGTYRFSGEAPVADIAALIPLLDDTARSLQKHNRSLNYDKALYDAARHHFSADSSSGGGRASKTYTPLVVVSTGDAVDILNDNGDDVILACTDGTQMTGRDLINAQLSEHTFFGLVDPVAGPVNLYQAERFANFKQRILAKAETIVCARDGCLVPAEQCQMHHINGVKQGGLTNARDITPLCRYHNGKNDDDPAGAPKNGRVDRINGRIHTVPPGGRPVHHREPIARMGMMDLV